MDEPNNFCIRHILPFVVFMELLVAEVHHLEIVIGRLRAAPGGFPAQPWSLGALQDMPFKKICFGAINKF